MLQMHHPQSLEDLAVVFHHAVRHHLGTGTLFKKRRRPLVIAIGDNDLVNTAQFVELHEILLTHQHRINEHISSLAHPQMTIKINLPDFVEY